MTTHTLAGTDLIGHVVIYIGSMIAHHRDHCVIVGYDEHWDRYTLDPLTGGPNARRIERVRRVSFFTTKNTRPVCACGHAIRDRLPADTCLRCDCTTHRPELTDDALFARVSNGHEEIVRDEHGKPIAVVVPYDRYLTDRAAAAFHGV